MLLRLTALLTRPPSASIRRWAVRDGAGQHMMARVKDLSKKDDKTFVIALKEPYGLMLDVNVPPLAGGTAVIQQFSATIKKTYRSGGKKRSILSATCKDKKLKFQARFTDNQGQLATGTDKQSCKRKG